MRTNLNSLLDFPKAIREMEERIQVPEQILGKELMQPYTNLNSGSRKILYCNNREQVMNLLHPENPIIATGYESQFGEESSSFVKAEFDYEVLDKVEKFSFLPGHHYWLLVKNKETNELDIIERKNYKHTTQAYGFLLNTKYLDSLHKGSNIKKGDVVEKSNSYNDYNDRMDGVNLRTMYISSDYTMEDEDIISESAAKKLGCALIKKIPITLNDNDTLLNLYGDNDHYKVMPDLLEDIQHKILGAIRRENKENILFTHSYDRLRETLISDEQIYTSGTIIDIDIYSNNPELLMTSPYNEQLIKYYNESIRFYNEIVTLIESFGEGYTLSYQLQELYSISKKVLRGEKFLKDKVFSNIYMEVTVLVKSELIAGDKICNRYGGKGVIAIIVKDEMMPILDNGERIEIMRNKLGVLGRENYGQIREIFMTQVGSRILQYIQVLKLELSEAIELICAYINVAYKDKQRSSYLIHAIKELDQDEQQEFLDSIMESKGIAINVDPISDTPSLNDLEKIYDEFPYTTNYNIYVPIIDSNGNIRYVLAHRKVSSGYETFYRLKQYGKEKFSVTSLSATNIRGQNCKSNANKIYRTIYSRTPIRFGQMETGNMFHLGMEVVIKILMIYSSSIEARKSTESLTTGDPFNIDVDLDDECSNRNVEALNTILKVMGLRLVFDKIKIDQKPLFIPIKQDAVKLFRKYEPMIPLFKKWSDDGSKQLIPLFKRYRDVTDEPSKWLRDFKEDLENEKSKH